MTTTKKCVMHDYNNRYDFGKFMAESIKQQLEGMLESGEEGTTDFQHTMIVDLRRMEVRYTCTASGNETVCKYFSPNGSATSCSHKGNDGECFTLERNGH